MKQVYRILLLILVPFQFSIAQDHYLELNPACANVRSPFTKVHVIDNLANKELLGFVQKGAFNKREQIRYTGSIADSLGSFFTANSLQETKPRELAILFDEIFLSETTGGFSESGSLKLSVRLFAQNENRTFSEMFSIDSVFTVRGMDVTKKLLRSVNDQFCNIALKAINLQPGQYQNLAEYKLTDLYVLDSLEKQSVPIYLADKPVKGVYNNYDHLKMNTPNDACEIFVDTSKANKIRVYKVYKVKSRKIRLETEGVYAVSDGEKLYKATGYGFYKVDKKGTDLFYDRPASISEANTGALVGAAFGLVGSLVAAGLDNNKPGLYRFKINYRRGNSVPIAVIQ
jgi:hypothetical protein